MSSDKNQKKTYFSSLKDRHKSFDSVVREIEAPLVPSLYLPGEAVDEFWARLEIEVSNIKPADHHTVILVKGDRFDDLNSFLSFSPSIVRRDVEEHLLSIRKILRQIYEQRDRFTLVTDGDLLGSWFELGMATGRIICLNQMARVGLPQLAHGFFPALGCLEVYAYFQKGISKSFWEKRFLWNVLDTPEKLNVDVIPVSQSEINIRSILAIYTHKEKFSRSLRSSRGLPHSGSWDGTKSFRKEHSDILWEQFWKGLKEYDVFSNAPLDLIFESWFEAAEHSALTFSMQIGAQNLRTTDIALGQVGDLWVDVTEYYPPISLCVLWALTNTHVVFYSHDTNRLEKALTRIHQLLLDKLGKKEFGRVWYNLFSWTICDNEALKEKKYHLATFASDGGVECVEGENRHFLVRLAGNHLTRAKIGTAELSLDQKISARDLNKYIWGSGVIFRDLILTRGDDIFGMPVSNWLRAAFLDQVLMEAKIITKTGSLKSSAQILFDFLVEDGWGCVGNTEWWQTILSHLGKRDLSVRNKVQIHSCLKILNYSSLAEVLEFFKSKELGATKNYQAPHQLAGPLFSEHMLIFTGLLGMKLLELSAMDELNNIDKMLRYAFEVPDRVGSPLGYVNRLGPKMLKEYADKFYSEWNFQDSISLFFDR